MSLSGFFSRDIERAPLFLVMLGTLPAAIMSPNTEPIGPSDLRLEAFRVVNQDNTFLFIKLAYLRHFIFY